VISEFLRDFRASSGRIAAEIRNSCQMKQAQVAGARGAQAQVLRALGRALGLGELYAEMKQAGKANDMLALNALLPRFETELRAVDTYIDSLQP